MEEGVSLYGDGRGMRSAYPHRYSTVTEWFGKGVKPKSYITCVIDFLEIILELKDKYNKWEVRKRIPKGRVGF